MYTSLINGNFLRKRDPYSLPWSKVGKAQAEAGVEDLVGSSGRELGREACVGGAPLSPDSSPLQSQVQYLLPEAKAQDSDKICVVIDLDETLVHSSFKVGPAQPSSACGLRGAYPGQGGRSPLDLHPWDPPSSPSSNSSLLTASEQC